MSDAKVRVARLTGYDAVRVVLGLGLLAAAGLKGHQLASEPVVGTGLVDSRWFLIVVVEFELLLGLWLLANLWPTWTRRATLLCFGLFAAVSLYKALSGADSCGCFGRVEVNPWYTLTLDMAAILALLRWRPSGVALSPLVPSRSLGLQATAVAFVWLCVGLPAAVAMGAYQPAVLAEDGIILGEGNLVILEPEKWIGKRFPLFSHVDIGGRLRSDMWLVLLVRPKCSACREAVVEYEKLARAFMGNPNCPKVAIIECPPYAGTADQDAGHPHLHGYLDSNREWFVETPATLLLDEGKVQNLFENSLDVELLHAIWGKQEELASS